MPLPQQVINQLNQDPVETAGWLSGALLFAAVLLIVTLVIYFGLIFVYQPYLNNNIQAVQNKVAAIDQSVVSGDQTNLIAFYSQAVNLRSLLSQHVLSSQLLNWLGQNTEANIYYNQFSFSSGNELMLGGYAKSEADISQQVAIFEASPEVSNVLISSISGVGTGGLLTFSATLILDPSLLVATTMPSPISTSTTP